MSTSRSPFPGNISDGFIKDYLVQQFFALRQEIIKRVELQNQIISLTLIVAGTFLTVVYKSSFIGVDALFVYPAIAAALAQLWTYHAELVIRIGKFILDEYENKFLNESLPRWEDFVRGFHKSRDVWAARAIFIFSEFIAFGLALLGSSFNPSLPRTFYNKEGVIALISVASIIFTILRVFNYQSRKSIHDQPIRYPVAVKSDRQSV